MDLVEPVRAFNRVVTERVGALEDEYLARGRPLGASRVLWEIGNGATDARSLRSRLSLDSGYLSRLLRLLESEGLVTVSPSEGDARVRNVELTRSGRREHQLLDRASDDLASSLLEPLSSSQRDRLIEAMNTVRALLTAGIVDIAIDDPASADAQFCIGEYFNELNSRFETGFDPDMSISADVDELTEPAGLLEIARLRSEPIGC
ncbi:MAG: MarR family transcriptional regulator, partial [Actinomycetota bacterium]